eukprot:jgi/Astpho2/5343/Aster-05893
MAPTVKLGQPSTEQIQQNPREAALYYQLLERDSVTPKDVEAYSKEFGSGKSFSGSEVSFKELVELLHKPGEKVEGSGNALSYAVKKAGAKLEPMRIPRRSLRDDDVHFAITHCGICHTDYHQVNDEWGGGIFPMVPGHEIVGIVTEVGPKVKSLKPGDRVGVGCFVESCMKCDRCKKQEENYCPKCVLTYNAKDYHGDVTYGGYSTHLVVPEHYALRVPKNLDLAGCAPLLCAGITTYSPLMYYGLNKPGMKLGVIGLGGLGHMAVKFGKALGLEVTVLSTSAHKKEEAIKTLKADHFIVSKDQEQMKAAANSLDGIIDTVAVKHPLADYLNLLKVDGTIVIVGAAAEPLDLPPFAIISKRLKIGGSMIGGIKETQEMLDFCGKHNITCEIEKIPMDYVNTALERLIKNDVHYRFVLDIQGSLINTK